MKKLQENAWEEIFRDLNEIYRLAIETGKLDIALKVKELLGKELGLFLSKKKSGYFQRIHIPSLSTDQLKDFIKDLEANLVLDPPDGEE